jgi:hypothetical protein
MICADDAAGAMSRNDLESADKHAVAGFIV